MNADAKVMELYPAPLSRAEAEAFPERIQRGFDDNGFHLYAAEVKKAGEFIGYVGLSRTVFAAPFTSAIEIGWRLFFAAWGHGYATEAGTAYLVHGFSGLGLREITSFKARTNARSIAVMERLCMLRNADEDFEHPALPVGHPLRPHVLYRIGVPDTS